MNKFLMTAVLAALPTLASAGCIEDPTQLCGVDDALRTIQRSGSNAALPYEPNKYGLGVGQDRYGRAVTHDPFQQVRPNAYGLGVGMDRFGRPVYHGQ